MSQNRFEELLSLLLDDDVTAEQVDELTQIVSTDEELLTQLRQHLLMSDRLSQYEDDLRSDERFMDAFQVRIHAAEDSSRFVAQVVASAHQEALEQSKPARRELWFSASDTPKPFHTPINRIRFSTCFDSVSGCIWQPSTTPNRRA